MESTDSLKSQLYGYSEIFDQSEVPLFQNKVYRSYEEAKRSPSGSVKLVQSTKTGFIYNLAFDDSLMNYDENYHNEQSNSKYFTEHQGVVLSLLESFGLKSKKIVEVGCGKANFFNMIVEKGYDIIGFDPAYEGNDKRIIKDYFSQKYSIEADVIVLRHTLEHISNPHLFIKQIAKANNFRGSIFIEVPTFDWIIKKGAFWDVFYEHCNYFTEKTLSSLFSVSTTGELFNGQYIYCYANLSNLKDEISDDSIVFVDKFDFRESYKRWEKFLNENTETYIWGAGAKGSTFLNLLDRANKKVKGVIDINPEKQNKYISVSGHPILGPEKLSELNCRNIIVMNENYLEEIKQLIKKYNVKVSNIVSL